MWMAPPSGSASFLYSQRRSTSITCRRNRGGRTRVREDAQQDLAVDRERAHEQPLQRVPGPLAGDLAGAFLAPRVPLDLDRVVRDASSFAEAVLDLRLEDERHGPATLSTTICAKRRANGLFCAAWRARARSGRSW
jgi:hypothetical protein